MKNIIYFIISAVIFTSCVSVKQIGKLNMISNRNVDPNLNYQNLTTYSGGSQKELLRSRTKTIEDAVDQTVRKIPGGEFLMNVKVYLVNKEFIAVEGDVWGLQSNVAYRGFKVGDAVTWKVFGGFETGTIISLKDDKTCFVKLEDGTTVERRYDSISKSN
ncbi:MAG: hypothetical protein KDC69_07825 [Flavobacteriaceae bacterium]|nr:hypothetical protein [Flavobacteriaceae bacterium]